MSTPIFKGFLFSLIPLIYYLLDLLNYSQAGKAGLLGFFIVTALFYWKSMFPKWNRVLPAVIVISVILLLAFVSFQAGLRDIFGVQQDNVVVVESLFNTTQSESAEFLVQYRHQIIKHAALLVLSLGIFFYLAFKFQHVKKGKGFYVGFAVFTFLAVAIHLNPSMYRSNPLFYFPVYYGKWVGELESTRKITAQMLSQVPKDLSTMKSIDSEEQRTVVWVIGESDVRHNWGLYGYERDTTPELDKHKEDLVIFKNIRSADASTVASVTKMLTPASLEEPNLWHSSPDVLSIAKYAGYKVFWLTNQGTDRRGVLSIFASHADETVFTNKGTSRGEGTFDEALFEPYEKALNDSAPKKLIIVHTMGSHPAYNFRYPKEYAHFNGRDDGITKALKDQGRKNYAISFRNQYDNAVLYQDFILSSLLSRAKEKALENIAWLYVADHGQDVSHNDNFSGHNHKVEEMWEVPMLLWNSNGYFQEGKSIPPADVSYQADRIESSVLSLLHIEGNYYKKEFDLFGGFGQQHYERVNVAGK